MEFIVVLFILIGAFEVRAGQDSRSVGPCNPGLLPEHIKKANQKMARKFQIPEGLMDIPSDCRAAIYSEESEGKTYTYRTICRDDILVPESHISCAFPLMKSKEVTFRGMLHYDEDLYDLENDKVYQFNYTLNMSDPNAEPTEQKKPLNYEIPEPKPTPTYMVFKVKSNGSMDGGDIQRCYENLPDVTEQIECGSLQPPERIEKANQKMARHFGIPDGARNLEKYRCYGVVISKKNANQIYVNTILCKGYADGHGNYSIESGRRVYSRCLFTKLIEIKEVLFNGMLHHIERVYDPNNNKTYHFNYTLNINDPNAEPTVQTEPWDYEITKLKTEPQSTSGVNGINIHFPLFLSNILMITIYVYKNTLY